MAALPLLMPAALPPAPLLRLVPPLDEAGYTAEVMTLVNAAREFSAAFEGFTTPTSFTDEDIAAMTEDAMARIDAGRKALQTFYDFAEVTPPARMEETHEAISTAAAKMADSANTYLDVVEGVLKDEVDPDDYPAAEDAYTASANEAANELVAALSKLDPAKCNFLAGGQGTPSL